MSKEVPAEEILVFLNLLFSRFDRWVQPNIHGMRLELDTQKLHRV